MGSGGRTRPPHTLSPPRPLLPLTLTCSTAFTEHLLSPGARNGGSHGPERSGSPKPHRPHRKTQAHTQSLLHSKNRLHLLNRGPDEGLSWVACEAALARIQGPGRPYRGFGRVHDACALGSPARSSLLAGALGSREQYSQHRPGCADPVLLGPAPTPTLAASPCPPAPASCMAEWRPLPAGSPTAWGPLLRN